MTELTQTGAVFWPVGSGDSTTIVIDDETVMQIDLRDLAKADDADTPEVAVVDELVAALPVRDGRPYLSVFALTHADSDHICGFADLLSEVTIGELWATPRLWREFEDADATLCQSARDFHEEAVRRVGETRAALARGEEPGPGDRVRIIGADDDNDLHGYADLPRAYRSYPGESVTHLDGRDYTGVFEAFIHAPFKADCAAERNDTSLALQITLVNAGGTGQILLMGDLAYETITKIFDYSTSADRTHRLAWDVLLAPHHCSKKVMYVDGELKQDILDKLAANAKEGSLIVSSSRPIPDVDAAGANPPHRMAANRYQEITSSFVCTMEHTSTESPAPVVFEVESTGIAFIESKSLTLAASAVEKAFGESPNRLGEVAAAAARYGQRRWQGTAAPAQSVDSVRTAVAEQRGGSEAPAQVVGFG